jgi:hypothetical protein
MKNILLPILITLTYFAQAQDEPYFRDMRSWTIFSHDSIDRYIFADTAYIRSSPDTKQPPIDTLLAGDNITITGATTIALTIRGIKGPWLKISYAKNGASRSGYIWQGLISCTPLRRGDLKFVYGIERRADSISGTGKNKDTLRQYLVRLKVVQNGLILARAAIITPDDESSNFSGGKIMSGMGLTNVQHMIVLTFSGEACGIPTYDYYLAWTKDNQLVRFPDKTNIGDAGAFYHSETFTFPNEKNGRPDMLLWDLTVEEATDKVDKHGDNIMKVTSKKNAAYTWDGTTGKITPVKL